VREISYYAACNLGLEEVTAKEIADLGGRAIRSQRGGVQFTGDKKLGYAACLWLRSAIRVQEVLAVGSVRDKGGLRRFIDGLDWQRYIAVDQTLSVDASIRDSFLNHSLYAAQFVKDVIVDQFRGRHGKRPSVDTRDPELPLKLHLRRDRATLYRDLSGASLHKRGYRPIQVKSPLNEATAAGLILLTGWDRRSPLLDPMCGSGTFVIEAAMLASDRAPGLERDFAFQQWPDFSSGLWRELVLDARNRARAGMRHLPSLEATDHHAGAIGLARRSIDAAGFQDRICVQRAGLDELEPKTAPALVVTNPPYGERLGDMGEVEETWASLGRFFRRLTPPLTAFVLSGDPQLSRQLRLRASRRFAVRNGPIDCRWLQYPLQVRQSE
jgi:putative N6-adenine-specific DNA methylase